MLCALGDLVEDVVVWLAGAPERGTDQPATIYRRRGGSAANVAAFAAAVRAPARFVGRVGDDALGSTLVADLRSSGVDVWVERAGRSGTVVVLVEPDGERTMLPDRAACTDLGHVPAAWLAGVRLLHLPAYSLVVEPLASSARAAAAHVRANGGDVTVDASSVSVLRAFGVDRFRQLVSALEPEVLVANADEAALLRLDDEPLPVAWTVVKQGARPVTVRSADGRVERVEVPALTAVVDTTGAGDAFAAGLLAALLRGTPMPAAVPHGVALAARALALPGASLEEDL